MNKVILITGGSRGIGAATAKLAAARGYFVCFSFASHQAAAERVVREITEAGGQAHAIGADVSNEADIIRLFEQTQAIAGGLDAFVNNAGILEPHMPVADMTAERISRVLTTNVLGCFIGAREAVRRMSRRYGGQGGAIVNVSSRAAQLGSPGEYVDYAASKAAVDTLTIGLAKEVAADGVRVNSVAPGVIYTDIHASGGEPGRVDRVKDSVPMKRGGTPDEVAHAILWLLSDEASYVTGTVLDVSGGR